jgi:CarboxypepD_reg-like domain
MQSVPKNRRADVQEKVEIFSMKRLFSLRLTIICLLGALGLLSATAAHAQSMRVEGTVRDAATGEPLVTAQVRVQGRLQGTLTDAKGHYDLTIEGTAKAIEVSHIGFRKTVLPLKALGNQRLDARLEQAEAMAPVIISAGPELVLEDKTIHLYDYEFFEGQLMMIIYDRKGRYSKLALVDAQDSILDVVTCVEEPGKLKRDCMGNVHAITKHFACQIFMDEGVISFFVDSLATFERVVEPCLGNIGDQYYFDYRRFNNQILDYLAYDMAADAWKPFFQVKDKNKMHQIMDPLGIYMGVATSEAGMMSLTPEDWKKVGTINPEFQFEQMVFFYPVDAPLRIIKGQVVIFDHLNGLIRSFKADGEEVGEVAIGYHKLPHWQRSIIVDEVRSEAYTLYAQHGYSSLRKIDLQTGSVGEPIEIPRQFAQKIMVRDGIAYFMYKQGSYDETNRLYRMRL